MRRVAEKVRKSAEYLYERRRFLEEFEGQLTLRPDPTLMDVVKEKPKVGGKLVRLGTAVILLPDPFSDVPGGLLLASGIAISKYADALSLKDIKPNLKRALHNIGSASG
jgi:hypothetical protein